MKEEIENNQQEQGILSEPVENDVANKKRRKVLKTAGVAGGAIAASQWHKPVLDSVVTPAHAQTTTGMDDDDNMGDMGDDDMPMPTTLLGATSGLPSHTAFNNQIDSKAGIASKVVDSLIPEAHAGNVAPSIGEDPDLIWRGLVNDVEQYQHCIELTLPAEEPPTTVDINFTGPDVYYDYDFYNGTYYYDNIVNFSGASMGVALTENGGQFEFTTDINGLTISGSIDDTLTSAEGSVLTIGLNNIDVSNDLDEDRAAGYGGAFRSESLDYEGYGAYWSTSVNGSCTIGSGPSHPVDLASNSEE